MKIHHVHVQNVYFGKDQGLCCFTVFSCTVEVLQKTLPCGHIKSQRREHAKEERGLIELKPKTMTERAGRRRRKSTVIQ